MYIALAALQLQYGSVQKHIKVKVLRIIESAEGLERWIEPNGEVHRQRLHVLHDLKNKLTVE